MRPGQAKGPSVQSGGGGGGTGDHKIREYFLITYKGDVV
jgi:hypothetical protein